MEGRKNVLVIEDVSSVREFLCQLLTNDGFEVQGCDDGMSALTASERPVHVIITDYHMPNMNGIEATRQLRARFPAAIIIGVSSDDKGKDFLAAGADAFLLKPYRYADLLSIIESSEKRS